MSSKKEFFISYTNTDEYWAEWIGRQLEDNGYTTILQSWDFMPGTNFVSNMHKALIDCRRFIAVISPDYFESLYCQAEWTAAFTKDPSSEKALLIPVRVKECKPEGLFAPIVYIDLYEVEKPEAVKRLLNGISMDRPRNRPGFPGTSSKPRFLGQLPYNNLPFRKNPNFTGREVILESIWRTYEQGKCISLTQILSGLGGVGKTQIVLEYAFRYGHLYETVWWVNSENPLAMMESYSNFAHKNGLVGKEINERDIILEALWTWMSKHENWLFIYDNAEDAESLYEYLPKKDNGHIIITSRYTGWGKLGKEIRIDVFESGEAIDFLIKSTGITDRENAVLLAKIVGYLPLALDQAAAYIAKNEITYEKYVELFKKYKLDIFKKDGYKSHDYSSTVAVTWYISIVKISNLSSKQMLIMCSFLAPDNIDKSIFTENSKHLPNPLAEAVQNELKYDEILSELKEYSLVNVKNNKLSIHRLLQEVIRQSVNKEEWVGYCLNIMSESFNFDIHNESTWGKSSELVTHVLAVANHIDEDSVDIEKVLFLYNILAQLYVFQVKYENAELIYRRALEIIEKVPGAKNPNKAAILNNLAQLFYNQGRYEEAEPLYCSALEIMEKVFGEKHPDTVVILNNLALIYINQGKHDEAELIICRALDIVEEAMGPKHPYLVKFLNTQAGLFICQGRVGEAEILLLRILEIAEESLGEKNLDSALTLKNLADIYYKQRRYEEAEPLYRRTLEIREELLVSKHPDTANTLFYLARLLCDQRRYEEAESLYLRALEIREEVLGPKHPVTAESIIDLSLQYFIQDRYEEAEPLYCRELEITEELYGKMHPSTAMSLAYLARLYFVQRRNEEAEPLYLRALEIREEVLGPKHPLTIRILSDLAEIYDDQGRI